MVSYNTTAGPGTFHGQDTQYQMSPNPSPRHHLRCSPLSGTSWGTCHLGGLPDTVALRQFSGTESPSSNPSASPQSG